MDQQERCLYLIRALLEEMPQYADVQIPMLEMRRWNLLRSLMNVRPPRRASEAFLQVQDAYLRQMTEEKGIVDAASLMPCRLDQRISVWQGDITRLRCDAIVNAANSQLLGCFSPCHGCIDNIIHTMSGVQLRWACYEQMRAQGHEEPTGQAKITKAYNLPCKYIIHTVGPIVEGGLTAEHERQLAACYHSCLEMAEKNGCRNIAFCCISTGVFMFPNQRAAEIAVDTVLNFYREKDSSVKVIFNVYKDVDLTSYQQLLG